MKCSSCSKNLHKSCYNDKKHSCRNFRDSAALLTTNDTPSLTLQTFPPPAVDSDNVQSQSRPPTTCSNTPAEQGTTPCVYGLGQSASYPYLTQAAPPISSLVTTPVTTTLTTVPSLILISSPPSTTSMANEPDRPNASLTSVSSLNPLTQPFNPSAHQNSVTSTRASQRKKQAAKENQNLDLELAKIELNTAQASITVLENTISDLKFKNEILEERVKQLETTKKNNIFDKYFPPGPESVHRCQHHGHTPPVQSCCSRPTPCCAQPPAQSMSTDPNRILELLSTLASSVEAIKALLSCKQLEKSGIVSQTLDSQAHSKNSQTQPCSSATPSACQGSPPLPPSGTENEILPSAVTSFTSFDDDMEDVDLDNILNLE